jgi:mono/diheme cytochrome c family protein
MAFIRLASAGVASFSGAIWRSILSAGIIVCLAGTASAQKAPPTYEDLVKEGAVIAERLCSSCHVMADGVGPGTAKEGLPSFKGIANRPDQTAARIRNVLILPHATMPDVRLSNPEIDGLIAYVDSLRAESAGAPLVPRRSLGGKPQYPDPT